MKIGSLWKDESDDCIMIYIGVHLPEAFSFPMHAFYDMREDTTYYYEATDLIHLEEI